MPNNGGTLSLDIDCTENPAALNEAYLANKFTQSLSFSIAGSCYGDITVPRNEEEPLIQVHGQVIFITGVDDSAALIDNDLTGNINLWATFGGGLYLRDLSVVTSGAIPVAYSRNGHGSVTNVSINRADGDAYAGIYVQEGGQVYVGDIAINGFEVGIGVRNGGLLRTIGDISIANVNTGISMQSGSFRGSNNISINAVDHALQLDVNSSWQGWGAALTITQGHIAIDNGSSIVGTEILAPNTEINVYHSVMNASGVTSNTLRANGSMVTLTNSSFSGEVVSEHNAKVEFYDSPLYNVNVHQNSSFIYGGDSIGNWDLANWQGGGNSEYLDTDGDSVLNIRDDDDDNDGYADNIDAFPLNPNDWEDSDNDGLGDNYELSVGLNPNDEDSDGDGIVDGEDPFPLTPEVPKTIRFAMTISDINTDGVSDLVVIYEDGDGVVSASIYDKVND